jgi:hypothetical protein
MLVSSPSVSKSRSFRFSGEDRGARDEATESARDVRPSSAGVAERPRESRFGRDIGGRIVDTVRFTCCGAPGRGRPDMLEAWYVWVGASCRWRSACLMIIEHKQWRVLANMQGSRG